MGDLARVLRVPNTRNRKPDYGNSPLCQIQELNLDRRYSLTEMLEFLKIDKDPVSEITPIKNEDIEFNWSVPGQWEAILENRGDIRELWEQPLHEGERSEVALSLANYAVHNAIIFPDDIATILHKAPALGSWAEEKPSALGYTIAKALKGKGLVAIKPEMCDDDDDDESATLRWIVGIPSPDSEDEED